VLVKKQKSKGERRTVASDGWPDASDGISINIYGRSGTGKTTLWATFPGPILCLVCSGGKRPGELRSVDTPEYREKITPRIVTSADSLRRELESAVDYETVVLDHASGLQDLLLKEVLGLDELPAQRSWGMAQQSDWGQCALMMKEVLRAILSLRCNRVIVAQEREFNVDTESKLLMPYVASATTPSVVGWLNPACDYIVRTVLRKQTVERKVKIGTKVCTRQVETGEMEYALQVGPDDVFTTKFRKPRGGAKLPDFIVDPDYDKIMELIRGGS